MQPSLLTNPPREFSLMPFWFWNDQLDEAELLRQIADFEAHGVHAFVIHPRVGLPRDIGWMSEPMLDFMRLAIEEAKRRDMLVMLYDEGMYPSGSSSGQVVAKNPEHQCRCLALMSADEEVPADHAGVLEFEHNGQRHQIVDRPVDSFIRGLHYIDAGPAEDEPPAADILNPEAVQSFIECVHDVYANRFGEHFGKTIFGIFTDEPNPLGRLRERGVWPGTTGIVSEVSRILGFDFTPHLPALFFDDWPDAEERREQYRFAIGRRLEQTWYTPLSEWCDRHGIRLCGHPDKGDEIGVLRHFDVPGQDVVWRWVEPDNSNAIEGPESTQGKASSSSKLHLGRERNSNECIGAFGRETTFDEVKWVAHWLLTRGVDLLIPHAFYYSIRGPRVDERPPQVGPNAPWWDHFKPFADECRRLCWINATGRPVCDIAILTGDRCPWAAAKVLFENQRDFNYLEARLLLDGTAVATADGIKVGGMEYRPLVVEDDALLSDEVRDRLAPFVESNRLIRHDATMLNRISDMSEVEPIVANAGAGLRVRRIVCDGDAEYAMLFNEAGGPTDGLHLLPGFSDGVERVDLAAGETVPLPRRPHSPGPELALDRHEFGLLRRQLG